LIIRYGGGNAGIAEYLEQGRKVDRHFSRDELDKRITVEGDLAVTQAVYDSIEDKGQERYLHITLSFNEPNVTEGDIQEVFQQYKKEFMTAYGDDEFNIYAEMHWPKIKEAYNHNTEAMEPRYPHLHVVIPKKNLLTGGFLNPQGMQEQNVKYLDAIQEKLNRDNGLSSPRDNPRVGSNHYESALGKYKDKEFRSKNGMLKQDIFNAMVSRDIRSEKSFEELLSEYGEVRTRNKGKDTQYFAIKVPGDEKFTNLKANIFGRSFIDDRALVIDPITDAQVARRVETWRTIQSKEIKYISNASAKVKALYKGLSLPERRDFLDQREKAYEERYRKGITGSTERSHLSGLPAGNYKPGSFEFAGGFAPEGTSYLHELRASGVDYFRSEGDAANRLFLQGHADDDVQHIQSNGSAGLRRDLYAGGSERDGGLAVAQSGPQSSVLATLLAQEQEKTQQASELQQFAAIRKGLDAEHLLAFAQIKYGVDPAQHPVSKAKDGSARIKVGKYNYNVSDFLTKHIGLEWSEASELLKSLYEKQQTGIVDKPKSKVVHINDWRKFRDEVYPNNIRTYDQLKNQIKVSYSLGLKAINAESFARNKSITKDETLTRSDKHYFRSIVILEKLQKVELLQQRVTEQDTLKNRVKYPYSTLFYDFATKDEVINVNILDSLKKQYLAPEMESGNTIGARGPLTPQHMPDGAEAAKRARLIAKLHTQEREAKELKIKVADLRPRPLANNAVAFCHKDNGKQIFVNHPDRLEMNRVTDADEIGVGLIFAAERFGNPLEVTGTAEFKEQIIAVAAERDMDITFTDEAMNKALEAKRLELGLEPLAANTITVPELAIDNTLPREQAIDKALLASKVAELTAVNSAYAAAPMDNAEREVIEGMLSDAEQRREELDSGFVDDARIQEIAQEDLAAFAHMEGKPEQQELAIGMSDSMRNEVYSGYMEQNGPVELKLTIDAAQAIQSEKTAQKDIRKAADMALMEPAAQRFEIADPRADVSHSYKTEAEAQEAAAALGSSRYAAIMEDNTRVNMVQDQGQWTTETSVLEARAEARKDQEQSVSQPTQAPELSTEDRAAINKARDDLGMQPLEFTNNGEPASLDINRFQQPEPPTIERLQAEVAGYSQAEQEARSALEGLEGERDNNSADFDEDDSAALVERISEARDSLEDISKLKANSEQELNQLAPELRPQNLEERIATTVPHDGSEMASIAAIEDRADIYTETIRQLGPDDASARATPVAVAAWVAADTNDYALIQTDYVKTQAVEIITQNSNVSPKYANELEATSPELNERVTEANAAIRRLAMTPDEKQDEFSASVEELPAIQAKNDIQIAERSFKNNFEHDYKSWKTDQQITDPKRLSVLTDQEIRAEFVALKESPERGAEAKAENNSLVEARSTAEHQAEVRRINMTPAEKRAEFAATGPELEAVRQQTDGNIEARTFERDFKSWTADQQITDPKRFSALNSEELRAEFTALKESPERGVEAKAENNNRVEERNTVESQAEARRNSMTPDEKRAEFAATGPELEAVRQQTDGNIEARQFERDFKSWKADQLLTDPKRFSALNGEELRTEFAALKEGPDKALEAKVGNDQQAAGRIGLSREAAMRDLGLTPEERRAEWSAQPESLADLMRENDIARAERDAVFEKGAMAKASEPLEFTHNGERAEIDLRRFEPEKPVPAPAVATKVEELQAINKEHESRGDKSVIEDIVRKGTLIDVASRHESAQANNLGGDEIREIATRDLAAYKELEGAPEQQALARSMGQMMDNPDYRDHMAVYAPADLNVTIEASQVIEQTAMSEPGQKKVSDRDMEL
jgi:hypothetical protein